MVFDLEELLLNKGAEAYYELVSIEPIITGKK
jgi:hypothetical protein